MAGKEIDNEIEKIIERLEAEGIEIEEKIKKQEYYSEIKSVESVINLVNDKECGIEKLQEFDICKEIMSVIARDCILKLGQSGTEKSEEEIINDKKSLDEYLNNDKHKCSEQNVKKEKTRKKRIAFLRWYIKYLDSDSIMERRALEEFGVKLFPYDPDTSLVSTYIYCKLLQQKKAYIKEYKSYIYEICCCDEKGKKYAISR